MGANALGLEEKRAGGRRQTGQTNAKRLCQTADFNKIVIQLRKLSTGRPFGHSGQT